ncbi:hypothetical protein GCM10023323_41740 [Streptomyces thinghirensis]|uniref:Uncharacterized protein n=1 Tax=Streptomyces thinghirensis TaxID=551547 RepID=A0ABP9T884_9ACTN
MATVSPNVVGTSDTARPFVSMRAPDGPQVVNAPDAPHLPSIVRPDSIEQDRNRLKQASSDRTPFPGGRLRERPVGRRAAKKRKHGFRFG